MYFARARLGPEIRATLVLALPLIAGQLSAVGMNVIDVVLAGHLGPQVLGPVASGSSLWMLGAVAISGVLSALPASVAHLVGAARRAEVWPLFRQALWLALALGVAVTTAAYHLGPWLIAAIGVDSALCTDATAFLHAVAFAAPGFALFCACRGISEGIGFTRPTFFFCLFGLLLLGPIGYVAMYGKFGLPALGARGSGLATAVVLWIQSLSFLGYVLTSRRYRGLGREGRAFWPARAPLAALLRLGIPIGISMLMEAGLFIAVALLIGRIGEVAIASHQIAQNVATIAFMVPVGLASAITVRVAQARGRRDAAGVRLAGLVGIGLTLCTQLISGGLMLAIPAAIVSIYTATPAIAAGAVTLLQLAGLFQVSDGIQVASSGALRGLKDTKLPMLITTFAYWVVGMPLGWWLAFKLGLGARGMWIGLIAGLSMSALLLGARFLRVSALAPEARARRRTRPLAGPGAHQRGSDTPRASGVDGK